MRNVRHYVPVGNDMVPSVTGSLLAFANIDLEEHFKEHENKKAECACFNIIMDAKYEKLEPQKVAQQQLHLREKQQKELAKMLLKHKPLFDGTSWGTTPTRKSIWNFLMELSRYIRKCTQWIMLIKTLFKRNSSI
jgi:hypothetical protein